MLAPRETATRERKSLDGLWRFALDADGRGRDERWWTQELEDAREIPVPASYNDVYASADVRDHVGDVWYQTVARIPERWRGQRIVLRFGAATHSAVVWVGERRVVEHEGGYTPFEADITDLVEPDGEVRITAVVSNVLTWHTIPPGYVVETAGGTRRQQVFHDFFNYAGLHRTVWLYTTPTSFVEDVTVTTGLDGSAGTVRFEVATGGRDAEAAVALRDAAGHAVARASGTAGELAVADVRPWRPGGSGCCRRRPCWSDSNGVYRCSAQAPATSPTGNGRSRPRSTGAMACCPRPSRSCFEAWRCSPAVARWKR
jgi:beta-glucuronidase